MKKHFQNILIFILISVLGFLVICNFKHFVIINCEKFYYNFENSNEIEKIQETSKNIKTNIEKIDKINDSYLSEKELSIIKNNLLHQIKLIESLKMWNYSSNNDVMNVNQFYEFAKDCSKINVLESIEIYRILSSNNKGLNLENFINYNVQLILATSFIVEPIINNYEYKFNNFESLKNGTQINLLLNNLFAKVKVIEYLSELTLESGELVG